jgi:hypothetical protein
MDVTDLANFRSVRDQVYSGFGRTREGVVERSLEFGVRDVVEKLYRNLRKDAFDSITEHDFLGEIWEWQYLTLAPIRNTPYE